MARPKKTTVEKSKKPAKVVKKAVEETSETRFMRGGSKYNTNRTNNMTNKGN